MAEPKISELNGQDRQVIVRTSFGGRRIPYDVVAGFYRAATEAVVPNSVLLVVTNFPLSGSAERALNRSFPGAYHALVRGPSDRFALRPSVRAALTGPVIPLSLDGEEE
jgi:hypothetical protein